MHIVLLPALVAFRCERPEQTPEATEVEPVSTPAAETGVEAPTPPEALSVTEFEAAPDGTAGPVSGWVRVLAPGEEPRHVGIEVHLEGLRPGPHAWAIHAGPCGQEASVLIALGATAGEAGLAELLVPGPDGVVEKVVRIPDRDLSLEQIEAHDYSVRVREEGGGAGAGRAVACAPLRTGLE